MSRSKPLVGVISDAQLIEPHLFHTAGDKYLRALAEAADVIPVIIPSLADVLDADVWLDRLDGIFLTGSYSMVDPGHYGETRVASVYRYDERRDALSFELVRGAQQRDLPLFGACRGMQDVNVALGGSLHQEIHGVTALNDHREPQDADLAVQYGDVHPVDLAEGGMLASITGCGRLRVNSLHTQGVNKLGTGLVVEATAEDGLIEAVRIESMRFGLAVQWHPEWQVQNNPKQKLIFEAFGEACRTR